MKRPHAAMITRDATIQVTINGKRSAFSQDELLQLLDLAREGNAALVAAQKAALGL